MSIKQQIKQDFKRVEVKVPYTWFCLVFEQIKKIKNIYKNIFYLLKSSKYYYLQYILYVNITL